MALAGWIGPIIGFVPGMALMYFMLRPFDGYFDDRRLFKTLVLGLVLGLIIAVFHSFIDPWSTQYLGASIGIFVIGFALFESLFKLVVLNHKKFRLRFDTTFYGVSFGTGIGLLMTMAHALPDLRAIDDPDVQLAIGVPLLILTLVMLAVNYGMLHIVTGAMIGYGCTKAEHWRYFFRAALIFMVFYGFMLIYRWALFGTDNYASLWGAMGFTTPILLALTWYVYTDLLPDTLPDELKKERRRKVMKRARGED